MTGRVNNYGQQRANASAQTGAYSTVEVGTVETLAPGTPAYVQNAGTQVAAKLNFGIPKGEKGEAGLPNLPEIVLTDEQITELITNQHITFNTDQYPLIEDLSKPIIHLKVGIESLILYKANHSNLIELLEFPSSQSMAASGAWAKGLQYSGFMYNKTTHIAHTVGYSIDPDDKTTVMTQSVGIDSDGRLWTAPGGSGGSTATTATLTVAGWSNNSQTVSVTGVTTSNNIIVAPAPANQAAYTAAGIICTAQGNGTLTFTCTTVPTTEIIVNVLIVG